MEMPTTGPASKTGTGQVTVRLSIEVVFTRGKYRSPPDLERVRNDRRIRGTSSMEQETCEAGLRSRPAMLC